MRKLLFAALCGLSMHAYASDVREGDWKRSAHWENAAVRQTRDLYYDARTIVRTGNKITLWNKLVVKDPTSAAPAIDFTHALVDCEKQQTAFDALATPARDPEPVTASWQAPPANSPDMMQLQFVCKNIH